jgi:DNA repair ATPase RecN
MQEIKIPEISGLKSEIDKFHGIKEALETRQYDLTKEIEHLDDEVSILRLVVELFKQVADMEIRDSIDAVENMLTEGLNTVFQDQDLKVKADVRHVRGKVSVELSTIRTYPDGTEVRSKSIEGFGGSVTTVQSILTRVIVIMKHGLRPLLVLDESLMAIESKYISNMGKLIRSLCERLEMDALVITHNSDLIEFAHTHWHLKKMSDHSTFEQRT